jgi:hypothetical protein
MVSTSIHLDVGADLGAVEHGVAQRFGVPGAPVETRLEADPENEAVARQGVTLHPVGHHQLVLEDAGGLHHDVVDHLRVEPSVTVIGERQNGG